MLLKVIDCQISYTTRSKDFEPLLKSLQFVSKEMYFLLILALTNSWSYGEMSLNLNFLVQTVISMYGEGLVWCCWRSCQN